MEIPQIIKNNTDHVIQQFYFRVYIQWRQNPCVEIFGPHVHCSVIYSSRDIIHYIYSIQPQKEQENPVIYHNSD